MRLDKRLGKALIAIAMALIMIAAAFAQPVGFQVQSGTPVTKAFTSAGTIGAQGGNATTLSATTETQTVSWQGFYGEVSANFSLENSNGNVLYSWTNATNGTIYLSRDPTVNFANITAVNICTVDESITGSTGSDSVNRTFRPSNNTELTVGGITIAAGTACAMNTYVNNASQSTTFEEIILTDDGVTTIYATPIEEDKTGFDGQPHDWQALVPSNLTTLTYYVYVEFE